MKKENPKHLADRLQIRQAFNAFLEKLQAMKKKKKMTPESNPDPRQKDFDEKGKKPDPKKVEQAKTEREKIIKQDRPVKK
jgi:hypothetical protein